MADPREEVVSKLRERLLTVTGVTTGIVAWDGMYFDRNATTARHFEEAVSLGDSIDSAFGGGRWRQVDGWYQVTVVDPIETDLTDSATQARRIESAFISTNFALTGGWSLVITNSKVADRKRDSDWLKTVVILYYRFTYKVT